MPLCFDQSEVLEVDNERVLRMKAEKPNQYKARAFVEGKVTTNPYLRGEHIRFSIQIGRDTDETLEMVYNIDFGDLPEVRIGDNVVVCGEFINSFKQGGGYPASPDGAIVHWVHHNPGDRDTVHEHGFMMFENGLAGFDDAIPGAWEGEIRGAGGNSHRPQKGSSHRQGGGQRNRSYDEGSTSSRWRPCSSIEECIERNGEF